MLGQHSFDDDRIDVTRVIRRDDALAYGQVLDAFQNQRNPAEPEDETRGDARHVSTSIHAGHDDQQHQQRERDEHKHQPGV